MKKIGFILFIIVIVILIAVVLVVEYQIKNLKEESYVFKIIMISDKEGLEILEINIQADYYYNLASLSYESYEFQDTVYYCEIARDYYSDSAQGYNDIKARIISKEIEHKLINIYIKMLKEMSTISYNMFEACEYFESASRSYDRNDYPMGDVQIEKMGGKIVSHDSAVIKYNELLAEFKIELESAIEIN